MTDQPKILLVSMDPSNQSNRVEGAASLRMHLWRALVEIAKLSPRCFRQFFQLGIGDSEFGEAPAALAGAQFAQGRAGAAKF